MEAEEAEPKEEEKEEEEDEESDRFSKFDFDDDCELAGLGKWEAAEGRGGRRRKEYE